MPSASDPGVAIGLRAHSGWAVLVALAGPAEAPVVVERRRLVTADPDDPAARFPYHAAEGLAPDAAERLVDRYLREAAERAVAAVGAAVADLAAAGHRPIGCGVLARGSRSLPELALILTSHARIHGAEGILFREILCSAAARHGLPVRRIPEAGLLSRAAHALGAPAETITAWLADLGRTLGPPWREDHKLATLAARLVLADAKLPA